MFPVLCFGQTAEDYKNKGLSKYKSGDYNGAIEEFTKSIELDPDYSEAYFRRGLFKDWFNDLSGAIVDFNKAIKLDPDFALA